MPDNCTSICRRPAGTKRPVIGRYVPPRGLVSARRISVIGSCRNPSSTNDTPRLDSEDAGHEQPSRLPEFNSNGSGRSSGHKGAFRDGEPLPLRRGSVLITLGIGHAYLWRRFSLPTKAAIAREPSRLIRVRASGNTFALVENRRCRVRANQMR